MKSKKRRPVKETDPNLWNNLTVIASYYPAKIAQKEYETTARDVVINTWTGTFPSGTAVADTPIDRESSVSKYIDYIIDNYKSVAEFIRKDFALRIASNTSLLLISKKQSILFSKVQRAGLDRVPLEKLESPPKTKNLFLLEAYTRRRAIFSLLKVCTEIDLKLLKSNSKLKDSLLKNPQKENSAFNKAVRIEPCFLQTKIGNTVIHDLDLWDKKNIRGLGIALNPKGKMKINSEHETSKHTSLLQMILFILNAIEPKISKLKDSELIELLKINGHYPRGDYDPDLFRKIRKPIFSK